MCLDDTVSASSNMDMEDRVSHLEQRLQLQEDEIQLLKSALADALRRLGCCEEHSLGMQPGGVPTAGRRPVSTATATPATKGQQTPFHRDSLEIFVIWNILFFFLKKKLTCMYCMQYLSSID